MLSAVSRLSPALIRRENSSTVIAESIAALPPVPMPSLRIIYAFDSVRKHSK